MTQHIKLKHQNYYTQITSNSQAKAAMLQIAIQKAKEANQGRQLAAAADPKEGIPQN